MPRVTLRPFGFGVPRHKWEELGVNTSGETEGALWEETSSLGETGAEKRKMVGPGADTVGSTDPTAGGLLQRRK